MGHKLVVFALYLRQKRRMRASLPIDPLLPAIVESLATRPNLVLQAAPGAGKTTRVPLALAAAPWLAGRKVVVLEPRRLPARMAARYMAQALGEAVGDTVGYRVRLDSRVGPKTRVELVTDGLFLRRLQADPGLEGIGCLVFDEFHERGLETDLALALALEAQALNPELRLLVMSATLDAAPVAALLGGAPVLTSEGRAFPVEIRWAERAPIGRIEDAVADTVRRALREESGSVLVFLPGAREIRRVAERLAGLPPETEVWPLYGDLDARSQDAAIAPAPPGRRKVVLTSAIAETSLTIEGIRVVVDSGLARLPRYDPRSGMTRLETLRASQATATQRAGRAGRLEPGLCHRLWTEAEHRARAPQPQPEILAADPAPLALELALWGAGTSEGLAFLDPPPAGAMAQAQALLRDLGALDAGGRPTAQGRAMAALGLHPRLAHMILAGKARGLGRLACGLAALLSGRDPFRGEGRDSDLRTRVEALFGEAADPRADRGALAEARALLKQWSDQAGVPRHERADSQRCGEALALAYPDRVAQARGAFGHFRLAGGRGAVLPPEDRLAAEPWLAVADLDGAAERARIFLAAPLDPATLEELFAGRIVAEERLAWDARAEAVTASRIRRLDALVLEERRLERPAPEAVAAALAEGIRQIGMAALPWTPGARALQARLQFLHRLLPEAWPDRSDEALLGDPLAWLAPRLAGLTRRAQLQKLDLTAALLDGLSWQQRQELDRLAPASLPVPTGREVPLDYSGDAPVLAVKLQELFGQRTTPAVGGGRMPVVIHLLSPAGRPVQVTRDLEGFWKGSYAAVRAELRGRYPRHPWPEDPLEAAPQRGVKRPRR